MPTLTFNITELMNLSRVRDLEKLTYVIRQFKGEVKSIKNNEMIVELEPDRPDILCVEGLARAIRSFLEIDFPKFPSPTSKSPSLKVYIEKAKLRPYIACAIIKDINVNDELITNLMDMQEALHITIGRNRRKVAIGIHDYDKISPPIIYTEVCGDEKMIPLDTHEEMCLKDILIKHPKGRIYAELLKGQFYPVYMDAKGIFSFPPIINSERTRVTESTRNLFIELTGIDENTVIQTLNIIVCNILERGGSLESVLLNYPTSNRVTPDLKFRYMDINLEEFRRLIGLKIDVNEAVTLLKRMEYIVNNVSFNKIITVSIPPFRVDILHPVDVIEDMAIAYGYDNITPELPQLMTIGKPSLVEVLDGKLRELMIGMGFQEVMTFTLTNVNYQTSLMNYENLNVLKILNPVTEEYNCYRRWITPNLLRFLSQNKHVAYPQKIFEIGYVAIPLDDDIIVQKNLAAAIANFKSSFSDIKEVLIALMEGLEIEVKFEPYTHPSFIEGRVAVVKIDERNVGLIGEINPRVLVNFEIEMPVSIMEITHCQPVFPERGAEIKTFRNNVMAKWF